MSEPVSLQYEISCKGGAVLGCTVGKTVLHISMKEVSDDTPFFAELCAHI